MVHPRPVGIGRLQMRHDMPRYENLDVPADTAGSSDCDLKRDPGQAHQSSSLTYNIDLAPMTHLVTAADSVDGCVVNSCHKFGRLTPRYYRATASPSSSGEPHTVCRMGMTAAGRLRLLKAAAISQCCVSSLTVPPLCCGRCLLMTWQDAIMVKLLRQP